MLSTAGIQHSKRAKVGISWCLTGFNLRSVKPLAGAPKTGHVVS